MSEFQKNSNFLDYPYSTKKTTLKYEDPVHKGPKNYKKYNLFFFYLICVVGEWEIMGAIKRFSNKMIGLLQSRNLKKMNKFHFSILREDFDNSSPEVKFNVSPYFII